MIYQFKDVASGELVDLDFPMQDAPEIGSVIRNGGRKLRRLPPTLSEPLIEKDVYRNFQVTRGTDQSSGADGYESNGVPVFKNKRSLSNWAAEKTGEGIIPISLDD